MEKIEINNGKLKFERPRDFRIFSRRDFEALNRSFKGNEWACKSEEKHFLFDITWKKVPMLGGNAPIEKVAKNTEKTVAKRVPVYGKVEDVKRYIAGQEAAGFRYTYVVDDIEQMAEYIVVKIDGDLYAFSCIGRTETFDNYYNTFAKMLDSVEA